MNVKGSESINGTQALCQAGGKPTHCKRPRFALGLGWSTPSHVCGLFHKAKLPFPPFLLFCRLNAVSRRGNLSVVACVARCVVFYWDSNLPSDI